MIRIARLSGLAAASVLAIAAAFATPARGTGSASAEALYYGKTSQGLAVSIPVKGTRIPADWRSYVLYRFGKIGSVEFHAGVFGATTFRGGKLVFHHLEKSGSNTGETWFQAVLSKDGKRMTGTFREHDFIWGKTHETGTIRFSAQRWAGERGIEWSGKTADNRPLTMSVRYRLEPRGTINGKPRLEPEYAITVPATTRPLACRAGDGTSSTVVATLPELSGELTGSDDLARAFTNRGGLATSSPARGTATGAAGATIQAELAVKQLRLLGNGLAATGSLSYQGTVTSETGVATCARKTSTFTLRPS